jgi:hypothetical protein
VIIVGSAGIALPAGTSAGFELFSGGSLFSKIDCRKRDNLDCMGSIAGLPVDRSCDGF